MAGLSQCLVAHCKMVDDGTGRDTSRSPLPPMIRPHRALTFLLGFAIVSAMVASPSMAFGQSDPIVARAVQYLKATITKTGTGETALAALALIKADVPASDPALVRALSVIEKRF